MEWQGVPDYRCSNAKTTFAKFWPCSWHIKVTAMRRTKTESTANFGEWSTDAAKVWWAGTPNTDLWRLLLCGTAAETGRPSSGLVDLRANRVVNTEDIVKHAAVYPLTATSTMGSEFDDSGADRGHLVGAPTRCPWADRRRIKKRPFRLTMHIHGRSDKSRDALQVHINSRRSRFTRCQLRPPSAPHHVHHTRHRQLLNPTTTPARPLNGDAYLRVCIFS